MPDSKEPTIDELAVAYLAAEGRTQMEIARTLNLSQSAVSRLYATVKQTHIRTIFCTEKVSAGAMQEILRRTSRHALEARLKELAGNNGQQGPVVHSIFVPEGSLSVEQFAEGAAPVVHNLMKQVRKTVGVAWGSVLWQTTQKLRAIVEGPWREKNPVGFIPLCGDPLVDSLKTEINIDRTSSRIASELSRIVNGDAQRPEWLGLVPAFIPRTFSERDRKVIDRLIDLVPFYGRIFGPRDRNKSHARPLAEDLDMILTAAGDSVHPVGFGQGPLLQLEPDAAKELGKHIHGDIGGVLIPNFDQQSKRITPGQKLVKELTDLWTGLKMEHLEACARQAFAEDADRGKRPGVTLLGYRKELADVVLQAVQRGLVNHLIVGSPLESAIEKKLPLKPATPSSGTA
jgi:hypothetical protein